MVQGTVNDHAALTGPDHQIRIGCNGRKPNNVIHLARRTLIRCERLFTPKKWSVVHDRLQLARRSSRTSRSSLVTPSRKPVSISCLRTHSCKVWGTQPIFGAIDSMAAHSDGYLPRCSSTMRTARSRTSGENLFDLFMAPSSQEKEPPQNPGRFNVR